MRKLINKVEVFILANSGFFIITAVYLILILIMLPLRQAGYQDDFAYYQTVRNFLSTGALKISEWSAATLIFQTYWGVIFAEIFGLSYKSLHFSNIFLFYFGLVAFYFTLKELSKSETGSVILTISFLAFPNISRFLFTFMSDTFYLSLVLISIFFTVKSIKTGKTFYFFLSALFSGLALLERQFAVALMLAQLLTYLALSYYKKKFLFKEMSVFFGTCLIFILPLVYWVKFGNNLTSAQVIYVQDNFKYLQTYIIPKGFNKFRVSNDIYDEIVLRTGRYVNILLGLSTFSLLFYLPNWIKLKFGKKDVFALFLGGAILFFLYYRLYLRSKYPDWPNLIVFDSPEILGTYYAKWAPVWKKIFNLIVFAGFIPWSYVVGSSVIKFFGAFVKRRKVVKSWLFWLSGLLFSLVPVWIILAGYKEQGPAILKYMFMIYLFWAVGLIIIFILYFFVLRRKITSLNLSLTVLFLVIFGVLQMTMTVFGFFSWEEYIIPFIPVVFIWISLFFPKKSISLIFSLLVLIPLLYFSVSEAKGDYEGNGILWETAETKINQGLLKPTEAGLINWAWFPYFYFEESFAKKVNDLGGDKAKVRELHTWWDNPDYNYKKSRLLFIAGGCKNVDFSDGSISMGEISTKSIFSKTIYCLKYYPKRD